MHLVVTPAPTPGLSRAGLLVIAATTLISVMNSSMGSIVLPDMRREFDVGPDALSWVVTAYLIPFATGTVIYGRLADVNGSRRLYILGLALFAAGSLAVAAAPSFSMVIAMRVAQGLGGTAVPALGIATIIRFTPSAQRGPPMGVLVLAVGLGFAAGPIIGGVLTDAVGWQGPFLFTGAAGLVLLPLALRWVPGFEGTSRERIDWLGALLITGAITGTVIAVNRLPAEAGDSLGLFGLALALLLFGLLAARMATAKNSFIPPALLRAGRFPSMGILGFAMQGTHFGLVVLLPLLMEEFHQLSVIEIGVRLLPGALALGVFGVAGGRLAARTGERILLIAGSWLMLSGALILHLAGVDFSTWNIALVYMLVASGYGMVNAAVIKAATDPLPEALAGIGAGVFNLMFFFGGAVAVAIAGAILLARESAVEAWDPVFDGTAVAYSDAMLVVVGFSFVAFLIAILQPPERTVTEPAEDPSKDWLPLSALDGQLPPAEKWAVKPRAKPITSPSRTRGRQNTSGRPPPRR